MENLDSHRPGVPMQRMINSQFLYNPHESENYCHAPTLIKTTSGDLFATWYAYPAMETDAATLIITRKPHGEKQWETSRQVLDEFKYSAGNPVLFEDPVAGKLWLLYVILRGNYWDHAQLTGIHSVDAGRTWSRPARLWPRLGMMVRHPPLPLLGGALLLPAYDERDKRSVLLKSLPPFDSWSESYRFKSLDIIQPDIVRHGDGYLSIFFRPAQEPRVVWRSLSSDDGAVWSEPVRTSLPNPLSGISAFTFGDAVAVVNNHTSKHQRHPLSLVTSRDRGVTWSDPWHFENSPFEVSYPSFLCDDEGVVHGVYTYNRKMIKYVCFEATELE